MTGDQATDQVPAAHMRVEAVRVLHELNESTKAQQAFLNSCGDATWITDDERRQRLST